VTSVIVIIKKNFFEAQIINPSNHISIQPLLCVYQAPVTCTHPYSLYYVGSLQLASFGGKSLS